MADEEKKEEAPKVGPTGLDYAKVIEKDLEMYRNTIGNLILEVGQLQGQLKAKTDAQQQMAGMVNQAEGTLKLLKGEIPMPDLGDDGGKESPPEDPPEATPPDLDEEPKAESNGQAAADARPPHQKKQALKAEPQEAA
jgi:hypothetical protein